MKPRYAEALDDVFSGLRAWPLWSRLGWRDVRGRYVRTVLGPFWNTISLAFFVVAIGVVWSRLWGVDLANFFPFVAAGLVVWAYMSAVIMEGTSTFLNAEGLIKSQNFSFTMLAATIAWRNLIILGHNALIVVAVLAYFRVSPTWQMLYIFPGLLVIFLNSLWVAILLGILTTRFRDVQVLVSMVLQVAVFITPIFWTYDQLQGRVAFVVIDLNLLLHFIEILRMPMLGKAPSAHSVFYVLMASIVGWSVTLMFFSRFRHRIAYWL